MSVYHVLLHLQKRLPLGSFFRLLEDGGKALAPATRLLEVYAREQNREMLRDFYYSDDRRVESAILSLEESTSMMVCLPSSSLIFLFTLAFVRIKARKSLLSNLLRSFSRKIKIVLLKPRQAIFLEFLRLLIHRADDG